MANGLLDFVMSVVRDPDIAAQYAADPAQAIANAQLTDVTSADVNNLIPMVSDSLGSLPGAATDGNVWTSGAATAAFDAFTPQLEHAGAVVHDFSGGGVIDTPALPEPDLTQFGGDGSAMAADFDSLDPAAQLNDLGIDPAAVDVGSFPVEDHGVWDQLGAGTDHPDADPLGFDLLN
jgi:hypothetical protein